MFVELIWITEFRYHRVTAHL